MIISGFRKCYVDFNHFSLVQSRSKHCNPEFWFLPAFLELIFPTPVSHFWLFLGNSSPKKLKTKYKIKCERKCSIHNFSPRRPGKFPLCSTLERPSNWWASLWWLIEEVKKCRGLSPPHLLTNFCNILQDTKFNKKVTKLFSSYGGITFYYFHFSYFIQIHSIILLKIIL